MAANQSLLVETSEEDSFLAVVRHIADLLNEGQVRKHTSAETACVDARFAVSRACLCWLFQSAGVGGGLDACFRRMGA